MARQEAVWARQREKAPPDNRPAQVVVGLGTFGSGGDSLAEWLGLTGEEAQKVGARDSMRGFHGHKMQMEAATLRKVFDKLSERNDEARKVFDGLIDEEGRLRGVWLMVRINGETANGSRTQPGRSVDELLRDDDEIYITSPACRLFLGVIAEGLRSGRGNEV